MTMRPRSFDPDAATETAVSDLLRRQRALEDPATPTATTATAATVQPLTDSYTVASQTFSRAQIVDAADFVTQNSSDQTEINAAFGPALPQGVPGVAQGSITVVLAAGRYDVDGLVTVGSYGTLTGTGRGSNFNATSTSIEFKLQTGSEMSHLTFVST